MIRRLALVATSAALVACGAPREAPPPVQVFEAAAAATAEAATARFHATSSNGVYRIDAESEGVFDFASGEAELAVDSTTLLEQDLHADVRVVDGVTFVRGDLPLPLEQPPPPGMWVRLPGDTTGGGAFDVSAPATLLDQLRELAGEEPAEVGTEDVRGVATTHYQVTVPWGRLMQAADERIERENPGVEVSGGPTAMDELPVHIGVWVDEGSLLRRLRMDVDLGPLYHADSATPLPTELPPLRITSVVELYDYGVEVDVEPPPEDEVAG